MQTTHDLTNVNLNHHLPGQRALPLIKIPSRKSCTAFSIDFCRQEAYIKGQIMSLVIL